MRYCGTVLYYLLFFTVAAVSGCTDKAKIELTVISVHDGKPVSGAIVTAETKTDIIEEKKFASISEETDENGTVTIGTPLGKRRYNLTISHQGYFTEKVTVDFPELKQTKKWDKITLYKLPSLSGCVKSCIERTPIEGAVVNDLATGVSVKTDSQGCFNFSSVGENTDWLNISFDGLDNKQSVFIRKQNPPEMTVGDLQFCKMPSAEQDLPIKVWGKGYLVESLGDFFDFTIAIQREPWEDGMWKTRSEKGSHFVLLSNDHGGDLLESFIKSYSIKDSTLKSAKMVHPGDVVLMPTANYEIYKVTQTPELKFKDTLFDINPILGSQNTVTIPSGHYLGLKGVAYYNKQPVAVMDENNGLKYLGPAWGVQGYIAWKVLGNAGDYYCLFNTKNHGHSYLTNTYSEALLQIK